MMRAWILWIAVLCSCARARGSDERLSDGSAKPSATATTPSAVPAVPAAMQDAGVAPATADAGRPDAATSACADLSAAFQARLAAASGACATSADCECFTSIVESPACAGVTDATGARALNDLATRFRAAGCQLPRLCGPGRCAPTCAAHHCR
jgi:hypothetical protein